MLLRENELGWRLYKSMGGFTIKQAHPLLRICFAQVAPALLNILIIVAVWLLGGGTRRMQPALYALPFSLLIGLLAFRPGVLYVSVRRRLLRDAAANSVPFSCLCIEIGQDSKSGRHRVYLKLAEPPEERQTRRREWKRLAWESNTETEAVAVAEEFRAWGIGTPDPIILAVKGDRRLRLLAYAGYAVSFMALIALIFRMGQGRGKGLVDAEPMVILRAAQMIIAFLFLSVLPFAIYLFRLGRGAVRCGLLPPPGMRVLSDMKLTTGDKAVMRGRRMVIVGLVLIVIGLVGGLYVPYRLGTLYGEPLRSATPAASSRK